MLNPFLNLGCTMTMKVHFLFSHLEQFPENLGDFSDEQGKRFQEDIKVMEDRFQDHSDINMMTDCCWGLKRDKLKEENMAEFPENASSFMLSKRHSSKRYICPFLTLKIL